MSIRFMRCTDATKSASTKVLESGQPLYNPDTKELFIGDGQAQAKALKTLTPFVASEGAYTALLGTQNNSKGDRSVVVGHGNNITTTAEYANNVVVGANNTCHQISGGTIGASNKIGSDVAVANGSIEYRGYTVTYTTAKGYSNNSLVVGAANVLVPGQYSASDLNKTAVANVGNMIGGYRNKIQGGSANILTGEDNTIEGFTGSSLFGKGLIASTNYQTIVGVYNADAGTSLFVVGGGEAEAKKNVFSVGKDSITANVSRFDLGTGQLNSGKIYCSEVNSTAVVRAPHVYKGTWTGGTWQSSGELATAGEVMEAMKASSVTVNSLTTSGGWVQVKNGLGQYAGVAIASPMFYKFTEADQTQSYDNLLPSNKEVASKISTAINALDVAAITGSTTKTITSLSQTDGKVSATYSNIAFPVTSVAGKTGAVSLSKSDVGLGNVVNVGQTSSATSGSSSYFTSGGAYTLKTELQDYTDTQIDSIPSYRNEIKFLGRCQCYVSSMSELTTTTITMGSTECIIIKPKRDGACPVAVTYTDGGGTSAEKSIYSNGPVVISNSYNANDGISTTRVEYIDGTTGYYKSINRDTNVSTVKASYGTLYYSKVS